MRQRVAIAIALLNRPDLIVADEPTTALDVSIQAQILAEIKTLVRDLGTALIWISHDLATVSALASRILVMYGGRIVEDGPTAAVLRSPPPSLYPRTDRLAADVRGAGPGADADPGRAAVARASARGLRLPAALPPRRRDLPHRPGHDGACARAAGAAIIRWMRRLRRPRC